MLASYPWTIGLLPIRTTAYFSWRPRATGGETPPLAVHGKVIDFDDIYEARWAGRETRLRRPPDFQ